MTDSLHLDVAVRRGALDLRLTLDAHPGDVIALVGPNGAGKTTVLRCVAGLQQIDSGSIRVGSTTWDDPSAGTFLPAERRGVGMMFQDYVLFDHMSVLDNVAFPDRSRGASKKDSRALAEVELARLDLTSLAQHRPAALSGGQAQRVALARACVGDPRVLLLDEPFSALDADMRPIVRRAVLANADDRITLLVTHDPVDVRELATRVVELADGRVVQA